MRKTASVAAFAACALSLLLCACSRDLSRGQARTLIPKAQPLNASYPKLAFHPDGFSQGLQQGFWREQSDDGSTVLTERGAKLFADVSRDSVTLLQPVPVALREITGIADSVAKPALKEVQFSWEYKDVPAIIRRFVVRGGHGSALCRSYDDGWRVESLTLTEDTAPASLTAAERAAEEADRLRHDQEETPQAGGGGEGATMKR